MDDFQEEPVYHITLPAAIPAAIPAADILIFIFLVIVWSVTSCLLHPFLLYQLLASGFGFGMAWLGLACHGRWPHEGRGGSFWDKPLNSVTYLMLIQFLSSSSLPPSMCALGQMWITMAQTGSIMEMFTLMWKLGLKRGLCNCFNVDFFFPLVEDRFRWIVCCVRLNQECIWATTKKYAWMNALVWAFFP